MVKNVKISEIADFHEKTLKIRLLFSYLEQSAKNHVFYEKSQKMDFAQNAHRQKHLFSYAF